VGLPPQRQGETPDEGSAEVTSDAAATPPFATPTAVPPPAPQPPPVPAPGVPPAFGLTPPASTSPPSDAFDELGRQVAGVLRAANEEAARVRADAASEAEAIRAEARVQAEALRAEAEQDRDEAKRLLVRARERAEQMVAEAEQRAGQVVADAEHQARARVAAVLDTGRARLERLAVEERLSRDRLLEAQADLQGVIQRISRPAPVIDLTRAEATIRFGIQANAPLDEEEDEEFPPPPPPPPAAVEDLAPEPIVPERVVDPGEPDDEVNPDIHATRRVDPLTTMVRTAVDRAVAYSTGRDETPAPRPPTSRSGSRVVRRKRVRRAPGDPLPSSGPALGASEPPETSTRTMPSFGDRDAAITPPPPPPPPPRPPAS
jgi:F0F1-type ATP synthase membrane subunit b/b'